MNGMTRLLLLVWVVTACVASQKNDQTDWELPDSMQFSLFDGQHFHVAWQPDQQRMQITWRFDSDSYSGIFCWKTHGTAVWKRYLRLMFQHKNSGVEVMRNDHPMSRSVPSARLFIQDARLVMEGQTLYIVSDDHKVPIQPKCDDGQNIHFSFPNQKSEKVLDCCYAGAVLSVVDLSDLFRTFADGLTPPMVCSEDNRYGFRFVDGRGYTDFLPECSGSDDICIVRRESLYRLAISASKTIDCPQGVVGQEWMTTLLQMTIFSDSNSAVGPVYTVCRSLRCSDDIADITLLLRQGEGVTDGQRVLGRWLIPQSEVVNHVCWKVYVCRKNMQWSCVLAPNVELGLQETTQPGFFRLTNVREEKGIHATFNCCVQPERLPFLVCENTYPQCPDILLPQRYIESDYFLEPFDTRGRVGRICLLRFALFPRLDPLTVFYQVLRDEQKMQVWLAPENSDKVSCFVTLSLPPEGAADGGIEGRRCVSEGVGGNNFRLVLMPDVSLNFFWQPLPRRMMVLLEDNGLCLESGAFAVSQHTVSPAPAQFLPSYACGPLQNHILLNKSNVCYQLKRQSQFMCCGKSYHRSEELLVRGCQLDMTWMMHNSHGRCTSWCTVIIDVSNPNMQFSYQFFREVYFKTPKPPRRLIKAYGSVFWDPFQYSLVHARASHEQIRDINQKKATLSYLDLQGAKTIIFPYRLLSPRYAGPCDGMFLCWTSHIGLILLGAFNQQQNQSVNCVERLTIKFPNFSVPLFDPASTAHIY